MGDWKKKGSDHSGLVQVRAFGKIDPVGQSWFFPFCLEMWVLVIFLANDVTDLLKSTLKINYFNAMYCLAFSDYALNLWQITCFFISKRYFIRKSASSWKQWKFPPFCYPSKPDKQVFSWMSLGSQIFRMPVIVAAVLISQNLSLYLLTFPAHIFLLTSILSIRKEIFKHSFIFQAKEHANHT